MTKHDFQVVNRAKIIMTNYYIPSKYAIVMWRLKTHKSICKNLIQAITCFDLAYTAGDDEQRIIDAALQVCYAYKIYRQYVK